MRFKPADIEEGLVAGPASHSGRPLLTRTRILIALASLLFLGLFAHQSTLPRDAATQVPVPQGAALAQPHRKLPPQEAWEAEAAAQAKLKTHPNWLPSRDDQLLVFSYFALEESGAFLPDTFYLEDETGISADRLGLARSKGATDEERTKWIVEEMKRRGELVVFSKKFCPFSRGAKELLNRMDVSPKPRIIEVDQRPDGDVIKTVLRHLTARSTFPNVVLPSGRSLGGFDDIRELHHAGKLASQLNFHGMKVNVPDADA